MTSSNVNILLSSFPGLSLPPTVSFSLPSTSSIFDLTEKVASYLPSSLSVKSLILTTTDNKQVLPSSDSLQSLLVARNGDSGSTLLPLRLSVPLCGGKGGFGSQLRAAGGRMSSKHKRNQGDQNSSSRNLDGRRLRTVNEAKALAEYLVVKPEMEQKEKEERRKRWQSVVEVAERRQDELKRGGKERIDGQWMNDKEEMTEKAREAVLLAMKEGDWTDNLRDAIMGGSSTSASDGSEEASSSNSDSDEGNKTISTPNTAGPSAPVSKPAPRRFIGFDDDDEFMSDSGEEEADESDVRNKGKARA
ncbi:hypothetical protein N7495_003571 [Penicillium taxi]|uniref:uncharacterized protein n=1 Tax=Penicillium taxi TaxID=168475 RepID=UPI0025456BDF|nr:uncharacterized protein N7495_003571 [Penicillium taxi]KAJ5898827.1 hypothetical protein N7495_003571 [Penicillium taxi]